MNMLRGLSIRKKLIVFFGIVCSLTVAVGLLCLVMLAKVSQASVEINEKWLPGVRLLDQMHSQHSIMQRMTLTHALCQDASCRADYEGKYREAKLRLDEGFQQFQKLTTSEDEINLLTHLNQLVQAYDDAPAKAIAESSGTDQAKVQEALRQSTETYDAAYSVGDEVMPCITRAPGPRLCARSQPPVRRGRWCWAPAFWSWRWV